MLAVGQKFPDFELTGVINSDPAKALKPIHSSDYAGKWLVVFFWPKDFSFVCPSEIAAFGALERDFQDRDAQLLGVSIDSEYVKAHERALREHGLTPEPIQSAARIAAVIYAVATVAGACGFEAYVK